MSNQQVEALGDFVTQAVVGVMMAMRRLGIADDGKGCPQFATTAEGLLAKYLNECYNSLLADDDEFVTEMFQEVGHRCPVCLFHIILDVCKKVLPAEVPVLGRRTQGADDAQLSRDRDALTDLVRPLVDAVNLFVPLQCHCSGLSLDEDRQRWHDAGTPQESVFSVVIAEAKTTTEKRVLFVGGLDESVDESVLQAVFVPFGELSQVQIPTDPRSRRPRGFGFVTFEEEGDAREAMENMNHSELFGRVLKVGFAKPSALRSLAAGAGAAPAWEQGQFWGGDAATAGSEQQSSSEGVQREGEGFNTTLPTEGTSGGGGGGDGVFFRPVDASKR